MTNPKNITLSDQKGIHTLVMAAKHFGVKHVIICPGSRNAPLTISFNRSGLFNCCSIPDERAAGFYALGLALSTGKPVILICTSGSASINFAPALVEAFYLKVPVIAITADRPLSWTDQGNGQTIRQEHLYDNFIRNQFSLISDPETTDDMWYNRRKLSEVFNTALTENPGPVHINVPMAEPLYKTNTYAELEIPRFHTRIPTIHSLPERAMEELAATLSQTKKAMILVGQMLPAKELNDLLNHFSERENVVILTETTSNVHGHRIISTIDRLVMPVKDEALMTDMMPDILLTMGGAVVSKKIKALLRRFQPAAHWHIHPHDKGLDTYQGLTLEIPMEPAAFLAALSGKMTGTPSEGYASLWQNHAEVCAKAHESYIGQIAYSDFQVYDIVLNELKSHIHLHMANSSPVRYVQLFGSHPDMIYHANRGTSGIDGCTSTAAGWALGDPEQDTVILTGDLAFVYDSNALWNNQLPQNLKIIVVNNQGGGIFRIVDGADKVDELEKYFEAHHDADIQKIGAAFGIPCFQCDSAETLTSALPKFFRQNGCAILEVKTPQKRNAPILKGYFKHISAHLEKSRENKDSESLA